MTFFAAAFGVVGLVVFLLVVGIALYLTRNWLDPTIRTILIIIIVILFVVWLLAAFGLIPLPAAFQVGGTP